MPHEPHNEGMHKEMLILLNDFNDLCVHNNIKYSLHGGTLLGAVREKGFIPWDDDMDVTMTRNEFEKFKSVIKKSESLPFDFEPRQFKLFKQLDNGSNVWLDIFIYDYISENAFIQKFKILNLSLLKAWLKTSEDMKVTRIRGVYKGWKYLLVYFIHLLGIPFSDKYKIKVADKIYVSFPGKRKLIHRSNDQYSALGIILPASSMDKYETLEFEGFELMVTCEYNLILRTCYGDDYMTPKRFNNDVEAHTLYRKLKDGK